MVSLKSYSYRVEEGIDPPILQNVSKGFSNSEFKSLVIERGIVCRKGRDRGRKGRQNIFTHSLSILVKGLCLVQSQS